MRAGSHEDPLQAGFTILFGMILGALSYRGLSSLVVDRAPAVTQLPAAGAGTGPVKWENDTVVPVTKDITE